MLAAINNVDISDRYMVHFLFLLPLLIVLLLDKLPLIDFLKNLLLIFGFLVMALLVYTRESAIFALGIS